jgi:hypothetical protein
MERWNPWKAEAVKDFGYACMAVDSLIVCDREEDG